MNRNNHKNAAVETTCEKHPAVVQRTLCPGDGLPNSVKTQTRKATCLGGLGMRIRSVLSGALTSGSGWNEAAAPSSPGSCAADAALRGASPSCGHASFGGVLPRDPLSLFLSTSAASPALIPNACRRGQRAALSSTPAALVYPPERASRVLDSYGNSQDVVGEF